VELPITFTFFRLRETAGAVLLLCTRVAVARWCWSRLRRFTDWGFRTGGGGESPNSFCHDARIQCEPAAILRLNAWQDPFVLDR